MSKYKSFANKGSFSEFQLDVPDQTAKMQAATTKKIQGMQAAQKFLEGNRALYLEAQKYAQQQEELSREQNFKLQNQERQAYKNALTRDYDIEMSNMLAKSKTEQNQLQQLGQLSKSAFELFGTIQEEREEAQRVAAHDIYIRTGATYKDALALQKINDNITRQEFGALKVVQDMVPSGDPQVIDGLFEIHKNRNSKIWIEHKVGLQNAVNNYPIFADQALQEILVENDGAIPDIESALSRIQREFIHVNFVPDKTRPEVLEQAGVYKEIRNFNNTIRTRLQKDKREENKKTLKFELQTGFAQLIRDNGVDAALAQNSDNPTRMKREALIDAGINGLFSQGAARITPDQFQRILEAPGGGPNGMSINEAYGGSDKVKEGWRALRQFRQEQLKDSDTGRKLRLIQVEDNLRNRYNEILDSTGTFTLNDLRNLQQEAQLEVNGGAGYTSQFLNSIANTTEEVQEMEASMANANKIAAIGGLTTDYVLTKMVFTHSAEGVNNRQRYLNLGASQERINANTPVGAALKQIRADVIEQNTLVKTFYDKGTNIYSVGRAQDAVGRKFREAFELINQMNPNVDEQSAIEQATKIAIQERERLYKLVDKQGNFGNFIVSAANQRQAQLAMSAGKTFQANVKRLVANHKLTDVDIGKELVAVLGKESLTKQFAMINSDVPPTIPVTVKYVAEQFNTNPLTIYSLVAPVIGQKIEAAQGIQQNFKPKFSRARNKYRYVSERVGRANAGDQNNGRSLPLRPSVVQYVSGDPAIANTADGDRIVYDPKGGPRGHGKENYHNHYEFATQEQAAAAKAIFDRDPTCKVTSYWDDRLHDHDSAHSKGLAVDVAPGPSLPYNPEAEMKWSAYCNSLIGFDPNE